MDVEEVSFCGRGFGRIWTGVLRSWERHVRMSYAKRVQLQRARRYAYPGSSPGARSGDTMYNNEERRNIHAIRRRIDWLKDRCSDGEPHDRDRAELRALKWALREVAEARGEM